MGANEETLLKDIEEHAAENLEGGLPDVELQEDDQDLVDIPDVPLKRLAAVVAFPTLAAAAMAGGVFEGLSARLWASLTGCVGIAIAYFVFKIRRVMFMNIIIVVSLFIAGMIPTFLAADLGSILNIGEFVNKAIEEGNVNRPPVPFDLGWRAILGWLMSGIGFASLWVAAELRKPAMALLVPMPILAITAISVPKNAQLPTAMVCLVLFAIGLGLLSSTRLEGDEDEKPTIGYELRRAARALPMIGAVTGVLYLLAQTNFLFPPPIIDPTQTAQKPKQIPISKVPDRVLFTVESRVTGPWRMGSLDVYDGKDWRLPPFAENRIGEVPESGIVETGLQPGVSATFVIKDLGGAVLPGLPNLVGIKAEGPFLAYDRRTGNIRLTSGVAQNGLKYTVVAATVPTIEVLRGATGKVPRDIEKFKEMPNSPPPPAVQDLMSRIPQGASPWDKLDFVRQEFLKTVKASGAGTPVEVLPAKVQDMLVGSKTGTPFEIVAGQAMLARWVGVPSRIGYGFDLGDDVGGVREVRPKHGASYLEVYFPGFKWLPVIGTPLQAKGSVASENSQFNPNVLPSDDIAVRLFVPVATKPRGYLFEQIRAVMLVVLPIVAVLLLIYYTFPALHKAWRRSRRRSWATANGTKARIAVAYAEWRDLCTDFGYRYDADTPLMFLDRVAEDEEHTELAWLVTRTLWGDLRHEVKENDALAAEELAKSLRKRMSQGHQITLRLIAGVSRLSLKYPYAPNLGAGQEVDADVQAA